MPCYRVKKKGQTEVQRKAEVKKRMTQVDKLIAARKVQMKVGPQGAITFIGLSDEDRDGLTDVCIYNTLTKTGSAAVRMALARAEQLAGRSIDRKVIAAGIHSHDEGRTWEAKG